MAKYRVEVRVLPPDTSGVQHGQYVVYRGDEFLEAGRVPDDPACHWAPLEGKMIARARARHRGEALEPEEIEVRVVPDGAIFDLPTPPMVGR